MQARLDHAAVYPAAFKALLALEAQVHKSTLEKPLMELVRIRASQINGCAYCVDMHWRDARKGGDDERRLASLPVWREVPFFTDRERAALEWTESLTLLPQTHVPDETWNAVSPHFTQEELVQLTLLVSAINAWNRFGVAFRKPFEDAGGD